MYLGDPRARRPRWPKDLVENREQRGAAQDKAVKEEMHR